MFVVYVIVSEGSAKRYIGQTNDLERRLREHNDPDHNQRKHTSRNVGPWRLAMSERYPTRAQAMARERWLKTGVGREWLSARLDGRASPPSAD
ncbi:MAG: GIY-YIG nuclease family protein [Phycisphaerales bacterium]